MYKHILIATDGSELATKAVEHGLALAKRDNARVTIVTVTEPWSAFDMAQEARQNIEEGNRYLRVLFVQAAWVVLIKPQSWERHGLKRWLDAAKSRLHRNQRSGDRTRQQASSHRLERTCPWPRLRGQQVSSCVMRSARRGGLDFEGRGGKASIGLEGTAPVNSDAADCGRL